MNHPNRIDLPAESDPRSLTGPAADTAIRPLVAARGLGVRRRGQWAVRHVDLHVHPGEIVTLIGPNGAGKST
ncbi:MAG: ATP-binding cassette domain-containing protein, partial [Rhodospirillales bacterium]